MTDPMAAINQIIGNAGAPAGAGSSMRWLVCDNCGGITQHDMATLPPGICSTCDQATSFKVMPSLEKAQALVASKGAAPAPAATPAPAPVVAPVVAERPAEPAPSEAVVPKHTRARKKAEPTPAVSAPAVAEPLPVLGGEPDYRALREAAVNKLIQSHSLNEVEIKEVGTGMIFTLGFTRWTEHEGARRPVYSFMELTDTPQSFKEELNDARAEDSMISVDVARVTGLTPEIAATAFNGELIASLRNATGPVLVTKGAKVRLGAKLSKQGRLIWFVTGVTK